MAPSTGIPRGVWMLGFVSLFMDVSSELIHSLLPVFMVTSLGATALMVGVVEGVAEATALIVKVFSGAISDWLGKRDDPAVGAARLPHAVGQARAHAARRALEHRDLAAFLLQHVVEGEVAPAHHRDHLRRYCQEIARGMRGDRHPVFEGVQQLLPAEARPGTGGE